MAATSDVSVVKFPAATIQCQFEEVPRSLKIETTYIHMSLLPILVSSCLRLISKTLDKSSQLYDVTRIVEN